MTARAARADVELIIFDFDGTLMDMRVDWARVRTGVGIADTDEPLGAAVERFIAAGASEPLAALTELELQSVAGRTLHGEVSGVLASLRARFALAVWTRNSRQVPERVLQASGLAPLFTVGREDVARLKPDPSGARLILDHFATDASRAVMVGDTWHDVQAAHAAGLASVLVDHRGSAAARTARPVGSLGDRHGPAAAATAAPWATVASLAQLEPLLAPAGG